MSKNPNFCGRYKYMPPNKGYSDKVYRYTASGQWETMPMRLSEGKEDVTAMPMLVPSSLFN